MPVRVPSEALGSLARRCFEAAGLPTEDASAVAEALIDANLRGHDSHGIARVPAYLGRLADGVAGSTGRMVEVARSGPLRRLDAGGALGPAAVVKATALAIELARDHGIALVAVGNSSHFGAAGFYARRAAKAGLLALVATNGPANMAPHGAAEPFLGTNALAVAIPLSGDEELVLDMSSSVAARGRIIRARDLGEPIEPGLAIDTEGNPTTDAAAALAGAVLPLGGAKGSGLALAISLATAILAGASFDHEAGRMHGKDIRPQDLGQIVLCIDPWRLAERADVERRVARLVECLHALRPAAGFDRVLYPGERGELERHSRLADGIPVPAAELESIALACERLGATGLAAEARALAGAAPE